MSSMLSFQIRQQAQQQQHQKQQEKSNNPGGLPSPPNSFCGEETTTTTTPINEKPAFLAQTRRDSLQTVFNDMHIKDYSTSLPENYTIAHSSSVPKKHVAPTMAGTATATAAATGGLTIRNNNRRPSDIIINSSSSNSLGMGGRRKSTVSRGLSESFSGQYRCTDCGKSYKHPNCLQKHRWEHSEEWELTKKLPLTKHQQVQMLEAAAILIGMDRIRSDVKKEVEEEEEEEEDIVVEEEEEEVEIDLDDIGDDDRKGMAAGDDDEDDDESIIIDDDDSIFMEDL
ncbi:unnamed protein product [Mucor circinelloides]|uniref:C2H2-type domain-containing protein n=1 Tax=Mucor circinelloides f. circinelloides (strain 1006PhL) TaxID=1220926 RepID=S2JN34_MUCC1|nr:hypothetical protein HMPREF1544_01475 [Mucor circinelloides 1006PhL]